MSNPFHGKSAQIENLFDARTKVLLVDRAIRFLPTLFIWTNCKQKFHYGYNQWHCNSMSVPFIELNFWTLSSFQWKKCLEFEINVNVFAWLTLKISKVLSSLGNPKKRWEVLMGDDRTCWDERMQINSEWKGASWDFPKKAKLSQFTRKTPFIIYVINQFLTPY